MKFSSPATEDSTSLYAHQHHHNSMFSKSPQTKCPSQTHCFSNQLPNISAVQGTDPWFSPHCGPYQLLCQELNLPASSTLSPIHLHPVQRRLLRACSWRQQSVLHALSSSSNIYIWKCLKKEQPNLWLRNLWHGHMAQKLLGYVGGWYAGLCPRHGGLIQ